MYSCNHSPQQGGNTLAVMLPRINPRGATHMNALVQFRSNVAGHLAATPEQRRNAIERIVSNLSARYLGAARAAKAAEPALATAAAQGDRAQTSTAPPAADQLGRDAFLRLLVEQLSNQDPLDPMDNTQMVTQLAQFSALEQQTKLNDSFSELSNRFDLLSGNVDQLNFISAQSLLGKYVEGVSLDNQFTAGEVESVHLQGSIVILTINGELVPMSGVLGISDRAPADQGGMSAAAPSPSDDAKAAHAPGRTRHGRRP
jgi:flagellar basal-body rod modification protein FlgD